MPLPRSWPPGAADFSWWYLCDRCDEDLIEEAATFDPESMVVEAIEDRRRRGESLLCMLCKEDRPPIGTDAYRELLEEHGQAVLELDGWALSRVPRIRAVEDLALR